MGRPQSATGVGGALAAGLLAAACGSASTSPTSPPPPPALQLTCPADQTIQSTTGQPIPVQYPAATSTGGTPPTTIVCTPASGSVFTIGSTPVACTATDARNATATCAFHVTLTIPPKIAATTFVAFGDSMTAGEVRSETVVPAARGQWIRPLIVDPTKAYPTLLLKELQARYTGQAGALFVFNSGVPGEEAVDGVARLPSVIDAGQFQVLLLMEGVNDFPDYPSALAAMQQMVEYARRRGLRVYLATEPPENPNPVGCTGTTDPVLSDNWASVSPYNDGLRKLAASEGVTLVDVYTAFHGDVTTLVDCDGLHPTPAGYQVIADTFFQSIQGTLETASPAASNALSRMRRIR